MGIEKCKELDWEAIYGARSHHIDIMDILMSIDAQTEDVNYALYELLKNILPPIAYSKKMSQLYPDRLFDYHELVDDNWQRKAQLEFNKGRGGLELIINNWELFKDKDLSYCLLNDPNNKNNITDSSLKEFMKNYGNFMLFSRFGFEIIYIY